jgi:hypothetical protein
MTAAPTALEHALALVQRGLSVIPVPRPDGRHDGKVPAIAWKEYQTRRATVDEIRAWFATPQNLAIVTGAVSGVVVVDADSPDALLWCTRNLPYTPWQTQTPRGFHLIYRRGESTVGNRACVETRDGRLAIDVRGDGGYVIAAGSLHQTGVRYAEAGDWTAPREALPCFWPGWLARPARLGRPSRPRPAQPSTDEQIRERARRYLAAIPRPEIGAGSDVATLSAACRLVRGFALAEHEAAALLWEWAGNRPGWTYEWIVAKVRHAERYGSEPHGALR